MGDYTHMHGTVKLKQHLVAVLAPFFNTVKEDTEEAGDWRTIADLPDSIKEHPGYKLLCHDNIGHWTPHAMSSATSPWGEKVGRCHVDESGVLEFMCGYKNYKGQQEAFLSLLPEIATEWDIEQDWTECMMYRNFTDGEGITLYKHTDAPDVMDKLKVRVHQKYTELTTEARVPGRSPAFAAPYGGKLGTMDGRVVILGAGDQTQLITPLIQEQRKIDTTPSDVFADFERKLLSDKRAGQHSSIAYTGYNPSSQGKAKPRVKAKRKQQAASRKKNRK